MFDFIERLRNKPEGHKKRIAFLISLSFTSVIFVIWFSVVYPDLKSEKQIGDKLKNVEKSPASSFSENFSSGLAGIGEEFSKITEMFSAFSTSPEYFISTSTSTSTPKQALDYQISSTTEEEKVFENEGQI